MHSAGDGDGVHRDYIPEQEAEDPLPDPVAAPQKANVFSMFKQLG